MNIETSTPEETADRQKKFKRYKKRYFAGRLSFSGLELEQCKKDFLAGVKPQRRFTKEFEITGEILRLKRSALEKLKRAEGIDGKVVELVKKMNIEDTTPGMVQYIKEKIERRRDEAVKLRRSVEIIHDVKIPRLVRTMAALKTMTLPGMVEDNGTVLQK
jgi:hypothetical protein